MADAISHLCGGSENRTVVQESLAATTGDRAVPLLGVMMPTRYTGLRKHVGNMAAEVGVTDTSSTDRTRGPKVSSLHSFRSACRMRAVSQYCDGFF
jgi:hypothetical protein